MQKHALPTNLRGTKPNIKNAQHHHLNHRDLICVQVLLIKIGTFYIEKIKVLNMYKFKVFFV